jgi:hypothetical protein
VQRIAGERARFIGSARRDPRGAAERRGDPHRIWLGVEGGQSLAIELATDGLVHREVFHEVPPHVEYSLTRLGVSLNKALGPLADWGARYEKR